MLVETWLLKECDTDFMQQYYLIQAFLKEIQYLTLPISDVSELDDFLNAPNTHNSKWKNCTASIET